jgi:hypothetical protein
MRKRKGISTPYMVAIVGVLISSMVVGLEADTLLGLQDKAIQETLPLVAQRVEAAMISVEEIEHTTVEMELQREFELLVDEGDPSLKYENSTVPIEPGMNFQVEEGKSDQLCLIQKPDKIVKLVAGGC